MNGTSPAMTIIDTLAGAAEIKDAFAARVRDLERVDKGVRASEMLFVSGTVRKLHPPRFLESGTAGGQSTLQLALTFPELPIISWDLNEDDRYAKTARERLAPHPNVELRYGNAMERLPEELQQDDAVLIDGPKGFKALRFAFELIATGKPSVVFIHDLHLDLPERNFLARKVAEAYFSDDPAFVWRFSHLDSKSKSPPGESELGPTPGSPPVRYGATFACIPRHPALTPPRCRRLILERGLWRAYQRLRALLGQQTRSSGG